MAIYQVGAPYLPGRSQWPETGQLTIRPGGVELTLFMADLQPAEIADIRHGEAEFAWLDRGPAAVLAWRFGAGGWSDAPYHPGRDRQAGLPEGVDSTNAHLIVAVVAVDADTGIVRALRQTTWPPGFAHRVATTVRRLLGDTYDAAAFDTEIDSLYASHPTTDSLVAIPGTATCIAGVEP